MDVLLTTVTFVAAVPPSFTVAPDKNPVPMRLTAVPPLADPEVGEIAVTVGAGLGGELDPLDRMSRKSSEGGSDQRCYCLQSLRNIANRPLAA